MLLQAYTRSTPSGELILGLQEAASRQLTVDVSTLELGSEGHDSVAVGAEQESSSKKWAVRREE